MPDRLLVVCYSMGATIVSVSRFGLSSLVPKLRLGTLRIA